MQSDSNAVLFFRFSVFTRSLKICLKFKMMSSRSFSSTSKSVIPCANKKLYKVAVLGAAGGIGQPLSLLMKLNPLVTKLSLYDIVNTPGVSADLGHINTQSVVEGWKGDDLEKALKDADVVIIPVRIS
jgi:malate dehydrogenase